MSLIEQELFAQCHAEIASTSQVLGEVQFALVGKTNLAVHDEIKVLNARVLLVQSITLFKLYDVTHINDHFEAWICQHLKDWVVEAHLLQVQVLLGAIIAHHDVAVIVQNVLHNSLFTSLNFARPVAARRRNG